MSLVFGVVLLRSWWDPRRLVCDSACQSCRSGTGLVRQLVCTVTPIVVLARSERTLLTHQWLSQYGVRAMEVLCAFALALQSVAR